MAQLPRIELTVNVSGMRDIMDRMSQELLGNLTGGSYANRLVVSDNTNLDVEQGGTVGTLAGMPVVVSPHVPEGQVLLMQHDPSRVAPLEPRAKLCIECDVPVESYRMYCAACADKVLQRFGSAQLRAPAPASPAVADPVPAGRRAIRLKEEA